jgi:hypothetical protein
MPRPCVLRKGGRRCCLYYLIGHAKRIASDLRRPSLALYHLLVLSAIAFSVHRAAATLPLNSRTDSPALSVRVVGHVVFRSTSTYC